LDGYDYSQNGWYFITICVHQRKEVFGNIENEQMVLNNYGKIVEKCWLEIPLHFKNIAFDEFVVMPNHVHGIIIIENGQNHLGNRHAYSLQHQKLSVVIGSFKSAVSKHIHRLENAAYFQWQKSFYDHIVRDETPLDNIRKYIKNNPLKWSIDKENEHLDNIDFS
jgi:REP element-mobilizing transposase RayT